MIANLALAFALLAPADDLQKNIYPLSKPIASPTFEIDVTADPDTKEWMEAAQSLATAWFPTICTLLATEDFKAPSKITLRIAKKQDAPAYASGPMISVSSEWIKAHPGDLGMIIHELTHVIQAYPRNSHDTGWLTEGIADYIRWIRYEPEAPRRKINLEKATYHDAYTTTAYFLGYASYKYNRGLVPALDRALRHAEDPMPLFESMTGKTADTLWKEYTDTLR
jgi:hypothetical protein